MMCYFVSHLIGSLLENYPRPAEELQALVFKQVCKVDCIGEQTLQSVMLDAPQQLITHAGLFYPRAHPDRQTACSQEWSVR